MNQMKLTGSAMVPVIIEKEAHPGVTKIGEKVCDDLFAIFGTKPVQLEQLPEQADAVILFATLGRSALVDELIERKKLTGTTKLFGKRECYIRKIVANPWPNIKQALVIVGSDKRGSIYGMFGLSEYLGVSPWYDFSDVPIPKKKEVVLDATINVVTKEPSVRYRGFFINDEWPAFGNWCEEHYGGFNAKMYDKVFELLLRLKGNYLWPAMWSSSFPLDGPGLESAKLADLYGVVMGTSHHEPCLRASEEWDLVRGEDSIYGNEWNYATNREGLLRYWKDGLARNACFENVITIGMRGERDTSMLGADATLAQNIDLLKDIIQNQRRLIKETIPSSEDQPLMMALYKEVEAYYYGDATTKGLMEEKELLDNVIIMLCEDNYGNMRTLPTKQMRESGTGFGMYYHFDYHGGPISYEWVNSTRLSKVWEQMTEAYEYGVRDIWIVNVGDLKPQELPLSYFMDLAYDFDQWGSKAMNTTHRYIRQFVERIFGGYVHELELGQIIALLEGYTRLNSNRRPEALRKDTYHPIHYAEAEQVFLEAKALIECSERIEKWIDPALHSAYIELVHYPVCGSANVVMMQIAAGFSDYAKAMGDLETAKEWASYVRFCIKKDQEHVALYHRIENGKWNGMGLSKHIGFVNWNDEGADYPDCISLTEEVFSGDEVELFSKIPKDKDPMGGSAFVALEANQYIENRSVSKTEWMCLTDYGKTDVGMKMFPVTKSFLKKGPQLVYEVNVNQAGTYTLELYAAPSNALTNNGSQCVGVTVETGNQRMHRVNFLPKGFIGGSCYEPQWCMGVLNNIHKALVEVELKEGRNVVSITGLDAGVVLERLVFYEDYAKRKQSYFGPFASN